MICNRVSSGCADDEGGLLPFFHRLGLGLGLSTVEEESQQDPQSGAAVINWVMGGARMAGVQTVANSSGEWMAPNERRINRFRPHFSIHE